MKFQNSRFVLEDHRSMRTVPILLISAILAVVTAFPVSGVSAQAVSNAKMHGTITDTSGALVPNAVVIATQLESGQTATAVTSASGEFTLPNLPVGAYSVKVTAPGFQTFNRTGITLQVSNDIEVNAPLTVGSTDTVVNVDASGTQLQTEDNAITTIVDQARTVDLPLNGRNAANLVLLSGGAAPAPLGDIVTSKTYGTPGTSGISGAVNISVAGGQATQINYLLDGGDNNDFNYNTNLPFPFPDALQEFSVETTGLAAQYGLHPAATVNIVTKSGTNQFHGGVFEFLRNNYANASNRISGSVDTLKRNQYGAFVGGPILHNRTFFFGGYQGTQLRIASGVNAVIPTAASIAGNWTPYFQALQAQSATGACPFSAAGAAKLLSVGFTTANSTTCTATVSPAIYSPVALNAEKILPTSTVLDASGDVKYAPAYPQAENQWIGRLDHTISPSQNVFARYFMTNYSAQPLFAGNLLNSINPGLIDRDKTLTLGYNYSITPNLTNALRLTGNRLSVHRLPPPDLGNAASLGSQVYDFYPNYLEFNVAGAFNAACAACGRFQLITNELQVADDVSYVKGKHLLQFGADYIDEIYHEHYFNNENGIFTFTGGYSGYSLVDFLLGATATYSQTDGGGATQQHFHQKYLGLYAQDTWHVSKNLVINAGLRWEPYLPPKDEQGIGESFSRSNFDAGIVSKVFPNAPAGLIFNGDPGVPSGFITNKLLDVSPRFGFAYDPTGNGKQSIRGSYSLLFDEPNVGQIVIVWHQSAPYGDSQVFAENNALYNNKPGSAYVDTLRNPFQAAANPFPVIFPPTASTTFPAGGIVVQGYDPPDFPKPYVNEYNLSYQIQVSPKWLLTANYIGTHQVHLTGVLQDNYDNYYPGVSTGVAGSCGSLVGPLPAAGTACSTTSNTAQRYQFYQQTGGTGAGPRYGTFYHIAHYGMSNYNGIILSANHQLSSHFTVLANYTYSRCLANENFLGDTTPGPQNPNNLAAEYGPCNFDVKHNLTVSGVLTTPKFQNRLLNSVGGGFQISPLLQYRTGTPFTVMSGVDASLTALGDDRPNVVPGAQVYNHNFFPGKNKFPAWFNPGAFVNPAPGTFGNEAPFSLRGPGLANVDVSASKFFPLYERSQLELRFEAFNVLNHPNYANPVSALNSASTVGQITSTATDPRLLQIAAKITF